jgi:poly-gamma-glutamate synthesis protein (capsule biosynthesis protein)
MNGELRLGLIGDVMLGRCVDETIGRRGFRYPWGDVLPLLTHVDLLICNLESTLTECREPVPKVFNFRAAPDRVECLVQGGIDICCVANNHILDFGPTGMLETLAALDSRNIAHTGAGRTLAAAEAPAIVERSGVRVGVLGCTDNEPGWAASLEGPGVAFLEGNRPDLIFDSVRALAQRVDIVVLSLHWGPNMRERPARRFVEIAHRAIESGANVVHGHSAHVFQAIEFYRDGVILYDTGDFVDDYAVDELLRNDRSFLFELLFQRTRAADVRLLPTQIERCQVNRARSASCAWSLSRMRKLCGEFHVDVRPDGEWLRALSADCGKHRP